MKQLIAFLLFIAGLTGTASAQQPAAADPARVATDQLVEKYKLTALQSAKMYKIQQRKLNALAEIETLKSGNPAKYREKLRYLQNGTLGSIKRLLAEGRQRTLYQQTQTSVRLQRAETRKTLSAAGASVTEIEDAELALYSE